MESHSHPKSPTAASVGADTPMADSTPPKYVPQFSAATEMILKRINSGAGSSNLASIGITGTPPGYEDMRRSVLMGMKTSMNMEIPSTPVGGAGNRMRVAKSAGSAGGKAKGSPSAIAPKANGAPNAGAAGSASGGKGRAPTRSRGKAGTKRKRVKRESESTSEESDTMSKLGGDSDSDDDDDESITALPKITQSGRQINKPAQFVPQAYEPPVKKRAPSKRNQEQALCKKCGRGHSPHTNMIVFCDGCNLGWHQMCHDPPVSEEAVKDENSPWFCADCSRKRGNKSGYAQVRGVSWQGRSSDEKRMYLNSLPHQELVSLLMQATILHPNIPIFPPTPIAQPLQAFMPPHDRASSRANIHPQQPLPPSVTATSELFSHTEANPSAPINFIRKIAPGSATPPTTASCPLSQTSFSHASSAPPTLNAQGNGGDSRESTPASPPYPKPGNGLMAKLGPDDEDIEWLVDDGDFDAFSHTVYDENGAPHN